MTREEKNAAYLFITAVVTLILVIDVASLWWHHWDMRNFGGDGFTLFTILNAAAAAALNVMIVMGLIGDKKAE